MLCPQSRLSVLSPTIHFLYNYISFKSQLSFLSGMLLWKHSRCSSFVTLSNPVWIDPVLPNPLTFPEKLEIQISMRSSLIFIHRQQTQNNFKYCAGQTKYICEEFGPWVTIFYSCNLPTSSDIQLYFWVVFKPDTWKVTHPTGNLSLLLL